MNSAFTVRTTWLGLASWLIPFVISAPFFDRTGQLLVAQPLFKSIMVVVGGASGTWLLVLAFRQLIVTPATAFVLGCYWLAINLLLDLIVLVLLMKMPAGHYLSDIGLRYLLIPIISTGMGFVAARERQRI